MGSTFKKCRVCGKKYEACRSAKRGMAVFRWQDVACSPECGAMYLQQINSSRGYTAASQKNERKKELTRFVEKATSPAPADLETNSDMG